MIIYFSATGNSEYIAKMIADGLKDEIVNSFNYIRDSRNGDFTKAKRLIFVCPVYVSAPVRVFEEFIRRSTFTKGTDTWFIVTGAGTRSDCSYYCKSIAKDIGLNYRGCTHVRMPQDYVMHFIIKSKDKNDARVSDAAHITEELVELIANDQDIPTHNIGPVKYFFTEWVVRRYYHSYMRTSRFSANDDCIRCGKCVKVCPLGNVSLTDNGVEWGDNCMHCSACINHCPKKAINYGNRTVGKPRYVCEPYRGSQYIK